MQELTLVAPDRRKHRQAIFDLTGKCFSQHGYWNWLRYCRTGYIDGSHYDWSASTVGLIGQRLVTHWGVWGYRMRIGSAVVRVGGIGAVATDGEFRRQGLMARTALAGVEAMRRAGYDMTLLFGIRDFYDRFGYVGAWANPTYVVSVGDLPKDAPAVRLRKVTDRQMERMHVLYNRRSAGLTGTAVRPTYLARRNKDLWDGFFWDDARGRLSGFVVVAPAGRDMECIDSCGDPEQALAALAKLAGKRGCQEVRFPCLHYRSELAHHLHRGICRLELKYTRRGDAMIRTLNLASALAKMTGELSRRMRDSHLSGWSGSLLMADSREKVLLDIDRGRVAVAKAAGPAPHAVRGGEEVAQLLIGADEPREIVDAGRIRLTGDAGKLLGVLFPNQHPMLEAADRF